MSRAPDRMLNIDKDLLVKKVMCLGLNPPQQLP